MPTSVVRLLGLSRIRESAIFGGLPIGNSSEDLRCGLAVADPQSGALAGWFWFQSGVSEILSVPVLPGWRHRAPIGSDSRSDNQPTIWIEPEVG
ncbi:MAG: DUF4915 domain-containing protein [Cyanobacteriota bacterium]|nr:DUF4915 domain-containing protein [Cyanobacteriota bacterium]